MSVTVFGVKFFGYVHTTQLQVAAERAEKSMKRYGSLEG